ncbi:YraN family protein [Neomicrococcus lactis]
MAHNQRLGAHGEALVTELIESRGMRVLDRNWRCSAGELDIVAEQDGVVVAVEVKTRNGVGYGHPATSVGRVKLGRLYRLVTLWCLEHERECSRRRIDVAAVTLRPAADPVVDYYAGVTL